MATIFIEKKKNIVLLALFFGALATISYFYFQPREKKLDKPNVLFIAVDDLNDWLGVLGGHPQAKTPHIDRLARQGVLFTNAHCVATACNPSRTALLCGIRPSTSGIYKNNQPWRPVLANTITLPQYFMQAGYYVQGMGKIFHGKYKDRASWHNYRHKAKNPQPKNKPLNGIPGSKTFDWGALDVDEREMADMKLAQWAGEFLQQQTGTFFLAVGFSKPHIPYYIPRKYYDLYPISDIVLPQVAADDLNDVPAIGRELKKFEQDHSKVVASGNWKQAVQGYLASISFVDACIGKLIKSLQQSRHRDNTIVVLWSDHGYHLGEKQRWRKGTLWEESTHIPLIILAPGVTKPRGRCSEPVSLLDLYPTLIELCDLPKHHQLEGRSLVPLCRNPGLQWNQAIVTTDRRQNHAVRSRRWRYIRYRTGEEELYDHQHDPMEWNNLARKADTLSTRQQLAQWLPGNNAPNAPERKK